MHPTKLVLALVLAGALGLATTGVAQAITTIDGAGTRWTPSKVSITRGHAVKWTATSGNHILKAYGGNWKFKKILNQGTSVRHVFDSRGTFKFYCTIHGTLSGGVCSGMCGKVTVG
jgi:plastocyanin